MSKQQIKKLRDELNEHNYRYYVLDDPTVSDAVYDQLFQKLKELEALNPQWITSDSPTQRVGVKPQKKFAEVSFKPKSSINPLAGLALGTMQMTQLTTGDNIHYYFFSNENEAQNFNKGEAFKFFKQVEAPASFALMNYANKNMQKYYFGLRNDIAEKDINVTVKILAVVVNNKYKAVSERVPRYTTHKVPVNE